MRLAQNKGLFDENIVELIMLINSGTFYSHSKQLISAQERKEKWATKEKKITNITLPGINKPWAKRMRDHVKKSRSTSQG